MNHGWEKKRLGDVCTITMGQSPESSSYNDTGEGVPFFQGCSDFGTMYPKVAKFCSAPTRTAGNNDILFSVRAPIGSMNFANRKCCIGRGLCAISKKDENQKYIYYALVCSLNKIIEKGTGSTFKAVGKDVMNGHVIPIPSKVVQEQIVSELDKINELIEVKRSQLADLDLLAQSLFYEMFGDPIDNPKGWEMKEVSEMANIKIGPFGSLLHKEDYIYGGTPLINPIHMQNGYVKVDENFTISDDKKTELISYLLATNDIIFGRRGDIGRCALITSSEDGFLCGTGSLFLRFFIEINPIFSLWVLKSPSITRFLLEKATGATMLNINCGIIASVPLILPPIELQNQFAAKIKKIEAQKESIDSSLTDLQTLLASRMDYWFND